MNFEKSELEKLEKTEQAKFDKEFHEKLEKGTVKGMPFSAQSTTETKKTLPDGKQVVNTTTSSVSRDSQGRTRSEQTFPPGTPPDAPDVKKFVSLHDPVAKENHLLLPGDLAKKLPLPPKLPKLPKLPSLDMPKAPAAPKMEMPKLPPVKTEDLGKKMIEGVMAEGKKTTAMIPAGHMGNPLPMKVVSESWHAPELNTAVLTKQTHGDSLEMTHKLTNIQKGEPNASLFKVPPHFKFQEPKLPAMPKVPKVEVPKVEIPKVEIPKVEIPKPKLA